MQKAEKTVLVIRGLVILGVAILLAFLIQSAYAKDKITVQYRINENGTETLEWTPIKDAEKIRVQIGDDEPVEVDTSVAEMSFANIKDANVKLTVISPHGETIVYNASLPRPR